MSDPFADLPKGHYGAILADPPWHFASWTTPRWNGGHKFLTPAKAPPYDAMNFDAIEALPVADLAATDCALFMWGIWVMLPQALRVIEGWGFKYKSCAFCWAKTDVSQVSLFSETQSGQWGLGYWTRQNSEYCLLATRGKPKRLRADIQQSIIEPRREHSRKPDCVYDRIERLVAGPYLELFARTTRPGWDSWGNQTDKFAPVPRAYDPEADSVGSYHAAIAEIGRRVKSGEEPVPTTGYFGRRK